MATVTPTNIFGGGVKQNGTTDAETSVLTDDVYEGVQSKGYELCCLMDDCRRELQKELGKAQAASREELPGEVLAHKAIAADDLALAGAWCPVEQHNFPAAMKSSEKDLDNHPLVREYNKFKEDYIGYDANIIKDGLPDIEVLKAMQCTMVHYLGQLMKDLNEAQLVKSTFRDETLVKDVRDVMINVAAGLTMTGLHLLKAADENGKGRQARAANHHLKKIMKGKVQGKWCPICGHDNCDDTDCMADEGFDV